MKRPVKVPFDNSVIVQRCAGKPHIVFIEGYWRVSRLVNLNLSKLWEKAHRFAGRLNQDKTAGRPPQPKRVFGVAGKVCPQCEALNTPAKKKCDCGHSFKKSGLRTMTSLVRKNMLTEKGYKPCCGNSSCLQLRRTVFKNDQFECMICNWRSDLEPEFIKQYKAFNNE